MVTPLVRYWSCLQGVSEVGDWRGWGGGDRFYVLIIALLITVCVCSEDLESLEWRQNANTHKHIAIQHTNPRIL